MRGNADNADIVNLGEALWGERWQSEMARALGVSRDTVQDWRQGRFRPRPGVLVDLLVLAQQRQSTLGQAIEKLQETAGLSA